MMATQMEMTAQQRIWNAIRRHHDFDWREIWAAASDERHRIRPHTVRSYVSLLVRAGILRCVRPRSRGRRARYQLRRQYDSPRAPRLYKPRGRLVGLYVPATGTVLPIGRDAS